MGASVASTVHDLDRDVSVGCIALFPRFGARVCWAMQGGRDTGVLAFLLMDVVGLQLEYSSLDTLIFAHTYKRGKTIFRSGCGLVCWVC